MTMNSDSIFLYQRKMPDEVYTMKTLDAISAIEKDTNLTSSQKLAEVFYFHALNKYEIKSAQLKNNDVQEN